jgi:hypothetical protein
MVQPPYLTTTRTIWPEWTQAWWSLCRFSLILSVFGHCPTVVQPPCLAITRTIWSKRTWAWWPPLSCYWPLLTWLSLPIWLSREPLYLSGLDSESPSWLACKILLKFPLRCICRMVSAYIYIVHFQFSVRLLIAYSVSLIIFRLFHIIVIAMLWSGNVFQVFWSLNWSHHLQLWVNKHHTSLDLPISVLVHIGFHEGL